MSEQSYSSIFKSEFQDLVEIKKALGFKYDTQVSGFRRIDAFFSRSLHIYQKWCKIWKDRSRTSYV